MIIAVQRPASRPSSPETASMCVLSYSTSANAVDRSVPLANIIAYGLTASQSGWLMMSKTPQSVTTQTARQPSMVFAQGVVLPATAALGSQAGSTSWDSASFRNAISVPPSTWNSEGSCSRNSA